MYKIKIKTLTGNNLTYHNVIDFKIEHGLIIFRDSMTKKIKYFPSINCEVEEI